MAEQSPRGLTKNTFILAAGSFLADISTEMLTPVLPIFLTQALGANGTIVGLVDGIAQAIRNLIDGFAGKVSDDLRKRKIIVLFGYALAALAKPAMGLSTIWQGVLAARIADRLGAGIRSAPRDALVASSVDKGHRGRGFGLETFGENAGAFVGPLATVVLLFGLQLDLRTIFYIAFIPAALAFVAGLFVRERLPSRNQSDASTRQGVKLPSVYWRYLVVIGLFSIGNSTNSFLILRTQEVGASLLVTTLIYAGFNLVAALASYPTAALSDRWGRKMLLLGSAVVSLIVYLGFSFTQHIAAISAFFLLYGLYEAGFRSVGKALASDLVPSVLRASGIGWFSATVGLCQLAASLVAGMLWDQFGHAAAFLYGAASSATGIVLILLFVQERPAHGFRA